MLRGLLGVLLLAEGRPLPAERLATLVWATPAERIRRGTVQVAVSRRRKWLREAGGVVTVIHGVGGYRLLIDDGAVDLRRLRQQTSAADRVADVVRRRTLLAAAVRSVRGPVLADVPGLNPADPLIRDAEQAARAVALMLAAAAVDAGLPETALAPVQALVAARPLDEPLHASLIELLNAAGWPSQALTCYEQLRRRLAEELGVGPGEQVRSAHLAVLAGDRDPQVHGLPQLYGDLPLDGVEPEPLEAGGLLARAGQVEVEAGLAPQ